MTTDELIRHADAAAQLARSTGGGAIRLFDEELRARALRRAELEDELMAPASGASSSCTTSPRCCSGPTRSWRRGAAALAPPELGRGLPGRVHPGGRGHEPDPRDRRVGAARGADAVRQAGPPITPTATRSRRRQHLGPPVRATGLRRAGGQGARRDRGRPGPASASRSPRACCSTTPRRPSQARSSRPSVSSSPSTTSAPATRRSRTCAASRSTSSRSTRASSSGLGHDPEDSAIVQAVIHMGQALRMTTLAEGVETAHHLIELRELECDIAQGFHFARPLPVDTLTACWPPATTGSTPRWVEPFVGGVHVWGVASVRRRASPRPIR